MSDVEIVSNKSPAAELNQIGVPARVISCVLGLMGFFTALLVGLSAANPGVIILLRAMIALALCALVGRILGIVGEICVREFLDQYKADRPTPVLPIQLQRLYKSRADHEAIRKSMKKSA